jgi:hypothetical protein
MHPEENALQHNYLWPTLVRYVLLGLTIETACKTRRLELDLSRQIQDVRTYVRERKSRERLFMLKRSLFGQKLV